MGQVPSGDPSGSSVYYFCPPSPSHRVPTQLQEKLGNVVFLQAQEEVWLVSTEPLC